MVKERERECSAWRIVIEGSSHQSVGIIDTHLCKYDRISSCPTNVRTFSTERDLNINILSFAYVYRF